MPISSVRGNDFTQASGSPAQERIDLGPPIENDGSDLGSSAALSFPRLGESASMWAETARIAGRLNAASVSDAEHEALLRERQVLLDKEFAGKISRQEMNRLEYIRWSLDRIEDAKHGKAVDMLEDYVSRYERLLDELHSLQANLQSAIKKPK